MSGFATHSPGDDDDVLPLDAQQTAALLERLGLPAPERPDLAALSQLQWAWLKYSPFHNIDLLAGTSPRTVEACVLAVLAGAGGPCHVQAIGWLAFLRALGFRAHLAAATIGASGDHLLCVVHLPEGPMISDVGNGHPYRQAVPLGRPSAQGHLGWDFRGRPAGHLLCWERRFGPTAWRTVYHVDPRPRRFRDFLPTIDAHHSAADFGPFLTGLRAVHLADDLIVTLRDATLTRYSAAGVSERPVPDLAAASRILRHTFRLAGRPVDAALAALARRIGPWVATTRAERLHLAVSLATTDRPVHLQRLLSQLAAAWRGRSETSAARLTVLVVDNGAVHAAEPRVAAARVAHPEICWRLGQMHAPGQAIAFSRRQQVLNLAAIHAERPLDAVWMLDDDLALDQLELAGPSEAPWLVSTARNPFDHLVRQRRDQPEASLLVGRVCGDPPSRPEAVLATQLLDAAANLRHFSKHRPDDPYPGGAPAALFALPDYYYDHARGAEHQHRPFLWLARQQGRSTREEAVACLEALPRAFGGGTPTRPLVHDPNRAVDPNASYLLRGGNAVFLDVDALFAHPYPTWSGGPAPTRRADMAGTAWLAAQRGYHVAEWALPMRHDRLVDAQPVSSEAAARGALLSLTSELDGVLVARAMLGAALHDEAQERPRPDPSADAAPPLAGASRSHGDGPALRVFAHARVRRIVQALSLAAERVHDVRAAIRSARDGWMGACPRCQAALAVFEGRLDAAEAHLLGGADPDRQRGWRLELEAQLLDPARLEGLTAFVAGGLDADIARWHAEVARALGGAYDC